MIESRNEVQAILYTNLRISEGDNLEVRRQKRAIQVSVSRYLKSKRRCMEALIQNNFTRTDFFCTLTFTEKRLPAEKVKANSKFAYFLRLLRAQGCCDLRYLKVLEHRHGDARFHFHVVIGGTGLTAKGIRQAWGSVYGHAYVSQLRPWDVPGLAKYLSKEAPDLVNKRSYSRSRPPNQLIDPSITRQWVSDDYQLTVPWGCQVIERMPLCENVYGTVSALSWLTPAGRRR